MGTPPASPDRLVQELEKAIEELQQVRQLNATLHKIGLYLEDIRLADIVLNYTAPRRLIWTNFVAGLARGLGLTIGTAIVLALLGTLLSKFLSIPIIGDYIKEIIEYVQSYRQ
ncbi:hypothetical protein EEL32_19770 [Brevibacillus laterosporus]|uniref:Uncharacterized protein n=1 Tax=Brevibacillus laterosporus TaxID=1465 RepID=A0A502I4M9_BRELA|nr:DUF5665 domain-containing protein [Brevibacillus laterosporus]QDX95215.1 hypothetical protein EEL30_24710 [Brevibacillus laterosporus]RAP26860.1 hypothetical protein C2W64_01301 [Brevibacillus laterosporus]TPG69129.1 hypothetical protein EEL31_11690 [Brevibacillus laterosporus]TPG81979.1 hypothetical protein EEL32_19770 [Brevibacillus laterosporus]